MTELYFLGELNTFNAGICDIYYCVLFTNPKNTQNSLDNLIESSASITLV